MKQKTELTAAERKVANEKRMIARLRDELKCKRNEHDNLIERQVKIRQEIKDLEIKVQARDKFLDQYVTEAINEYKNKIQSIK